MNTKTKKEIAKLSNMKLGELQTKFAEVIGEKTRCPNKKSLIRRITEALMSRDPETKRGMNKTQRRILEKYVGIKQTSERQVLPIRMNARVVQQLDKARKRLGLKSRTQLFQESLCLYLANAGETEVANLISENR